MSSAQLVLTASLTLCTVGFFGYMHEVLAGRVGRFTKWRELNVRQWVCFLLAAQFPVTATVLVVWRSM